MPEATTIEAWDASHPRWDDLLQLVDELEQSAWTWSRHEWHQSTHLLVAQTSVQVVGFLRFVVQDIGADDEHTPIAYQGAILTEAKILAFGVPPTFRRQGIGRALQESCIRHASRLGCYQVRSHSSGVHDAHHQLKLAMGFGIHPIIRGSDRRGVYFVLPLQVRDLTRGSRQELPTATTDRINRR